jgi:rhamnose transport system substrate-binding protein
MNKETVKGKLSVTLLASLLAVGLVGCASTDATDTSNADSSSDSSSSSSDSAADDGGLKIAIMPKAINIGYFAAWDEGAQKACDELGAECDYIGPNEATGPAQVQFINQVIQQGYDALVISAADQNAIVPALQEAQAAGITIVTSDADVAAEAADARVVSILPSAANRIGTAEVDWIAEAIGEEGSVAILSASATAANQNVWIEAMGPYLEDTYPNMSWVGGSLDSAVFYGDDDPTKSTEQFNAIINQYPDVAGIIAPTTVGVLAAAAEKKAKGADVKVTGLGLPSEMAPYIEDGTVEKVGLWNPIDLGYVAVYAAVLADAGEFDGSVGSSFDTAENSYIVVDGGIAFLGDPFTFTPDNIATFKEIY